MSELRSAGSRAPSLRLALQKGLLTTLAPIVALALMRLYGGLGWEWRGLALGLGVALCLGGLILERYSTLSRLLVAVALIASGGLALVHLREAPDLVLMVFLFLSGLLFWVWTEPIYGDRRQTSEEEEEQETALLVGETQAASAGSLATWFLAGPLGLAAEVGGQLLALAALLYALGKGLRLLPGDRSIWRLSPWWVAAGWGLVAIFVAALWQGVSTLLAGVAASVGTLLIAIRRPLRTEVVGEERWWDPVLTQPARLLVVTFLATGLIGGAVLSLPVCAARPAGIETIDALFTAFSATCVTGLIVLDTPNDYTFLGQVAILLLIQIGGLGIMTFSAAAMVFLRRRMGLKHEGAVVALVGSQGRGELAAALRRMLAVTFAAEGVGAVVLGIFFLMAGDSLLEAIWRGVFTAISAYCNAGFALQSNSLIPYQTWTPVLHVVAALIAIGGLGPAVVAEIPRLWRKGRLSLYARLVFFTSGILLFLPALLIAGLEWSRTLAGMSTWERLSNAWFQSVTTRTAGFNSIDMLAIHPATVTLMEVLMFIGGSPGGTAGGIKTTTIALLVLAIGAAFRRQIAATAGGWRIGHASIYKAATVLMLGLLAVLTALLAIQLTQTLDFQVALFEVLSALGTVGLSIGGTAQLDGVGKIIIMICMFVGRVGPLALFLSLQSRSKGEGWTLPEQEINVG